MLFNRWFSSLGAFNDMYVATGLFLRISEMAISKDKKKQADALTQIVFSVMAFCFLMTEVFPAVGIYSDDLPPPNKGYTTSSVPVVSPTPTANVIPTAIPEPTASPTPTASVTPTAIPEPTVSVTPTAIPEPTVRPTPTANVAPTASLVPTVSVTPTAISAPTVSPTPAVSMTPTAIPEPTASPTPAASVPRTTSPSPTPSPKPSEEESGEIVEEKGVNTGPEEESVGNGNNGMYTEGDSEKEAYTEEDESSEEDSKNDVGANYNEDKDPIRMPDCIGWSVASVKAYFQEIDIIDIMFVTDFNEYVPQDNDVIVAQSLEKDNLIENDCLPLVFQVRLNTSNEFDEDIEDVLENPD